MKNISTTALIAVVSVIGIAFLLLLANTGKPAEKQVTLPIKVEEFADFQCPACGAYYSVVKSVKEEFGNDIELVYKQFPLTTIHEFAYDAAIASEAARNQGKFEQYHDKLFENQENLTKEDLDKYATEVGLDLTKFKEDIAKPETKARVDADIEEGNVRSVSSTPTFFINGEMLRLTSSSSESPDQKLKRTIRELIEKAKAQANVSQTPEGSASASPTTSATPTPTQQP